MAMQHLNKSLVKLIQEKQEEVTWDENSYKIYNKVFGFKILPR